MLILGKYFLKYLSARQLLHLPSNSVCAIIL